tara:strand:+ start:717 stop:2090 length:1374 start_codon:yes stop_codon:yes gene_type:complete
MIINDQFENEYELLAMLLTLGNCKKTSKSVSQLTEGSFMDVTNRKIFKAISQLCVSGEIVDFTAVTDKTKSNGTPVEWSYLAEMQKNCVSAANVSGITRILREGALQRFSVQKLNECIAHISDSSQGALQDRLSMAQTMWSEVSAISQKRETRMKKLSEYMELTINESFDRVDGKLKPGYKSPFANLNDLIAPKLIPEGSLFVVGGLPKMGKTKVVSAFANGFARDYPDEQAVIYSLEMKGQDMAERAICEDARIDSEAFWRSTGMTDKEGGLITETLKTMKARNIWLDDTSGIGIDDIEINCRNLAATQKVGLIMVDYLTLMTAPKADRNDLAFGAITKRLKSLAKELGCTVVLLTQLSREVAKRPGCKRPKPQDSRDTGQIEQDCDFWLAVHKQAVFEEENYPHQDTVELILRLNRHGKTGTVFMNDKGPYLEEGIMPMNYHSSGSKQNESTDFM